MVDYLQLATDNGLDLDLDPDLSGFTGRKKERLESLFASLRQNSTGRTRPTYVLKRSTASGGSFILTSQYPNISQIPSQVFQGHFKRVGVGAPDVVCQFAGISREEEARALLTGTTVGELLLDTFGVTKDQRTDLKKAFYAVASNAVGSPWFVETDKNLVQEVQRKWPMLGKVVTPGQCRERVQKEWMLGKVAPDVVASGRSHLVGFYHDEVLVDGDLSDTEVETLTDRARQSLADILGLDLSKKELDPLEDALQWLKDCGGVMAMTNNPMARQLIKAGLAKKGDYDTLGRRTLVVVS